jgi:hypothetical protein
MRNINPTKAEKMLTYLKGLNPKPKTQNPKPKTQNPKPKTRSTGYTCLW